MLPCPGWGLTEQQQHCSDELCSSSVCQSLSEQRGWSCAESTSPQQSEPAGLGFPVSSKPCFGQVTGAWGFTGSRVKLLGMSGEQGARTCAQRALCSLLFICCAVCSGTARAHAGVDNAGEQRELTLLSKRSREFASSIFLPVAGVWQPGIEEGRGCGTLHFWKCFWCSA